MKKSVLVQIIKEAVAAKKSSLTDKVKAVSVPVSKLQKGDTMAADKSKVTSIKKDGDNFEITLSGGKKLNYKKDKQVQIIRAGSTLNEGTDTNWKDLWLALQAALGKEDDSESDAALKLIAKEAGSKIKAGAKGLYKDLQAHYGGEDLEEGDEGKHNNKTTGFKPLEKKVEKEYEKKGKSKEEAKEIAAKTAGSVRKKVLAKNK